VSLAPDFITTPDGVRLFCRVVGDGPDWLIMPGIGGELDFEPLAQGRAI
jgi:hypothetical protein